MKRQVFLTGILLMSGILLLGAGCSDNADTANTTNTAGASADDALQGLYGRYEAYDESKLALAETGKVVLFFKADWCPSCRELEGNIIRNKKSIPEDLAILTLNYDTELALRRKYGITTQHTLVQVDKEGTMIGKWVGSPTLNDVLGRLR